MTADTLSTKIQDIFRPKAGNEDPDTSPKEVVHELKEVLYLSKDLKSFVEFLTEGDFVTEGEHTFSVDTKYLKYACGVLKHVSSGSKIAPNLVKIVIFENQLKIVGYNQITFTEIFIPLTKNSSVRKGEEVSFIFDYPTLAKLVVSFEKHILEFTYRAEKELLIIISGATRLEISTQEETKFVRFHNKLLDITPIECVLNMETLQTALEYISLFLKKEDNPALSLLECRESAFLGGCSTAIIKFSSETFENVPLKFKQDCVTSLCKVLPFFSPTKVKLFETKNYFILRDQNLYFGIEKTELNFPSVKKLLASKIEESYVIPRANLLAALVKLSVVTVGGDSSFVEWKISQKSIDSILTLSIIDVSGKVSKDVIPIQRARTEEVPEEHSFFLNFNILSKIISFFEKSSEVYVEKIPEKGVVFKDRGASFFTSTILSVSKEV